MNRIGCLLLSATLAVGSACLCGCVSTPATGSGPVHLAMAANGMVVLDGKSIARRNLPHALKSQGISPDTPIVIAIPDSMPMTEVTALTRQLASAGFQRVAFTRPRHADVIRNARPKTR